jgi:predicted GH43/DUF377 family glycosyl hydrolase
VNGRGMNPGFTITENARLRLRFAPALEGMYVLSPFVWPERGGYRALLRLVNRDRDPHKKISRIHAARSRDGLLFDISEEPVLAPGPDREDAQGAEDPTVIAGADETVVYYSGWDQANERSTLLYARGSSVETLRKCGVAIARSATRANPKEATLARASDGSCRLFYEYATEGASRIGVARSHAIDGPWEIEERAPFTIRADRWDDWHLSPGPIVADGSDRPIMFYNGGDRNARWRIGWIAFNGDYSAVLDRSETPLIVPPLPVGDESDIAFAASAVPLAGGYAIYYSIADKLMERATVVCTGVPR